MVPSYQFSPKKRKSTPSYTYIKLCIITKSDKIVNKREEAHEISNTIIFTPFSSNFQQIRKQ